MSVLDCMKWVFTNVIIGIPLDVLNSIEVTDGLTAVNFILGLLVIGVVVSIFWRSAKSSGSRVDVRSSSRPDGDIEKAIDNGF